MSDLRLGLGLQFQIEGHGRSYGKARDSKSSRRFLAMLGLTTSAVRIPTLTYGPSYKPNPNSNPNWQARVTICDTYT